MAWPNGHGRLDAADDEFVQRARHAVHRRGAVAAEGDQLADHRVVIGRHGVARVDVGIPPDAVAARRVEKLDLARAGPEIVEGVLGVDAHLDGMLLRLEIVEVLAQLLAERDADLLLHQVDAVDLLGHGMLHLDAGVHLHEVEILLVVDEEFDACPRFRIRPRGPA